MRDDLPYQEWKKELNIWCSFTEMDSDRQGGALFLTLTGKARDAVRSQVTEKDIAGKNGVEVILAALDQLYLKDASQSGFAAFDEFIKYRRPAGVKISDYLIEFNLKYSKIKSFAMELPDGVLAYTLLTCANLPQEQEQICRATVAALTYTDMKQTIEKVVNNCSGTVRGDHVTVTAESQLFTGDAESCASHMREDQYYSRSQAQHSRSQRGESAEYHKPALNPRDEFGNPTPCRFCHSVYHWVDKCPDAPPSAKSGGGRGRGRGRRPYRRPGRGDRSFDRPL